MSYAFRKLIFSNKYQVAIPNYTIIRKDCSSHGGGLVICMRQSVVYSEIDISPSDIRLEIPENWRSLYL